MNAHSRFLAPASMLATLVLGVAVVGATGFVASNPAVAADKNKDKEQKNSLTPELSKLLKAAQEDLNAQKYDDALAKLKEADANPKKKPYDQHVLNQLAGVTYARLNNWPEAAKAFDAQVTDGFTEPTDMPHAVKGAMQSNYQAKNYDKVVTYGEKAIKDGYGDDDINVMTAQAYYLKDDYKGALKFEEDLIDADVKAGRTPNAQSLKLALSACAKLEDAICETRVLEKTVAYYPTSENWQQLLHLMAQDKATNSSDKATLQLYRLMSEVDVLSRPDEYIEMAQIALEQGSPGEAQKALEKGVAKGVFADAHSKETSQRLLDSAKKAAAADQASLAKSEKDADAASTGDKDVGVGFAYLGYGEYDKASTLLSKGLSKGRVKSEPEARLLLGIAQLKAGHKDQAVQTFQAVKGDPTLERIANLWSVHAKQA
jgi:outer membrane protein assembly factor BamD (BamD/ComL family)